MKKRLLSLLLCAALLTMAALPAAAAETADERLAAVTAKVKATLGLDTAAYTEFYGDLDEAVLAPTWRLDWSGETGRLNVSATEEGKILRMNVNSSTPEEGGYAPAFPAGSREEARAAAMAFLDKVLTAGETARLEESGSDRLNATVYRFYGEVLINGLSAGLNCSISVRCDDYRITQFSREDLSGSFTGGIPSPTPAVSAANAAATLRGTLKLRLEYELPDRNSKKAVLRYLPEPIDDFYADASSGRLVNLTELYQHVANGENGTAEDAGTEAEAPAAAADLAAGLTQAEQTGVEKLEGVLSREALDQKARAITALGLDSYTLSTVNYSAGRGEASGVSAALRYGRQVSGASWRRTVTLDARTGELISVSSSSWLPEEDAAARPVKAAAAQAKAEAFLRSQCAGIFGKTALYESSDALENKWSLSHGFRYAQKANGYFFPANNIFVGVDATDGSISRYNKSFDESVTFDGAGGVLPMEKAIDAWLATYDTTLQYVRVPTAVDYSQPEYEPLMALGVQYLYRLTLGYRLTREDQVSAIDAKTGEAVKPDWARNEDTLSYSDIAGHWAESRITELARYGVGFTGGTFQPNAKLTQIDLVALLLSADGYRYDPAEEGAADQLYQLAFSRGLLKPEERSDQAAVTRMETVRMMLDAVGYGSVARIPGIFRTSFTDDAAIPADVYGYAALAQGLKIVTNASFAPAQVNTRAQAAVMLYNLMKG